MTMRRHDFDGLRCVLPGGDVTIYLIYHGCRHAISDMDTLRGLFGERSGPPVEMAVEDVEEGPLIAAGSCLVNSDKAPSSVYLVTTGVSGIVARHFITDDRSFIDFGFDRACIKTIPELALKAIVAGRDISSANARRTWAPRRGD